MPQPSAHVPAPTLAVDETGTVRSAGFGDVYFSASGGVAETEHVFLAGNALPARWMNKEHFTIGELGFGTGLNFLVAWKNFVETNAQGRLHFVSIEKFPLTPEQLSQALAHQPELKEYAQQLIEHYPLRLPGFHRLHFDRVTLTLGFGDVADLLPELDAEIDAWFLDGFAPAKNEAMWSDEVLQNIARLSAPDASFATFTAAGSVKRGLEAVGFTVEKVPGFGSKRDMLVGRRSGTHTEKKIAHEVTVVSGGIAGCTAARALAERGIHVTLLEKETLASGASGNEAAVLYPQLTKYYTPATAFHFTAYGFMLHQLRRWKFPHAQTGMLKIGKDDEDDARLRAIRESLGLDETIARWVEADEASQLVGQVLERGGFWFPHGTWIAPAELCRALVAHENITVHEHHEVTALPEGIVVLANASAANGLLEKKLTFGASAGQVSALAPGVKLKSILCHKGYAIDLGDHLLAGATYDREDLTLAVTEKNHAQNIAELKQALPALEEVKVTGGRTSIRATTPGHLPYVGEVAPNLYVSVGHGSRGMISAVLAAEVIAAQITGEPSPISRSLRAALRPA